MQNLETLTITEGKAMNAIFNACRANEKRQPRADVSFELRADGNHNAILRNAAGVVVAIAIVDEFDI